MLNMIDTQDKLKNFSEEQLIREMQMPSGSAPRPYLRNGRRNHKITRLCFNDPTCPLLSSPLLSSPHSVGLCLNQVCYRKPQKPILHCHHLHHHHHHLCLSPVEMVIVPEKYTLVDKIDLVLV